MGKQGESFQLSHLTTSLFLRHNPHECPCRMKVSRDFTAIDVMHLPIELAVGIGKLIGAFVKSLTTAHFCKER